MWTSETAIFTAGEVGNGEGSFKITLGVQKHTEDRITRRPSNSKVHAPEQAHTESWIQMFVDRFFYSRQNAYKTQTLV